MPVENIAGTVINVLYGVLAAVIFLGIVLRFIRQRRSAVKTVEAIVVDKQKFSRREHSVSQAPRDRMCCVVTFLAGRKRLSFYVSEFSYDGYQLQEKGKLTYKGEQLIDFG